MNYLRFLWFSQPGSNEIVVYRFLRVLFGLTSSPFLLQGTIRFHCERMVSLGRLDAEFAEIFLENLYVDDNVNGAESIRMKFHLTFQRAETKTTRVFPHSSFRGGLVTLG